MKRTLSTDMNAKHLDQVVKLSGWVNKRRDHGGVIFVDLRDHCGLCQLVFNPENQSLFNEAEKLRNEFVIEVVGKIAKRPDGTINPNLKTGEIEVIVEQMEIVNQSLPLPFNLDDSHISEEVRLKYRYLDLRRDGMKKNIILRHQLMQVLRNWLSQREFIEIETPYLTKSTPEGARDYLVPSRQKAGDFYALPQSPQLFKQLLMVSGMYRYFQIVRCFRDEDLRADRQPEFTQLDIELSFTSQDEVMSLMEQMIKDIYASIFNQQLPTFKQMSYEEATEKYGTDRPDLRNPLELISIDDLMQDEEFKVFSEPARSKNGRVAVLKLPNGASLSRSQIDEYTNFVSKFGAKGLAYIKVVDPSQSVQGLQSPIVKFLSNKAIDGILKRTNAQSGDMLFFGASQKKSIVNDSLSALAQKLAKEFNLLKAGLEFVWIVDFPMFEKNDDGEFNVLHHPFTMPKIDDENNPLSWKSKAYDLVLNGSEIGGGSIRIHKTSIQKKVFKVLKIDEQQADEKFGFLLNGLSYGAPIHGGIAFGIDRLVMMMTNSESIREVIAFPKTQSGFCPLTQAPSLIDKKQLKELHIQVVEAKK